MNGCKLFFSLEVKTVKDAEDSEKNKTDSDHVDIKDDGKTQFITSGTDFVKLNRFHVDLSKLNNLSILFLFLIKSVLQKTLEKQQIVFNVILNLRLLILFINLIQILKNT